MAASSSSVIPTPHADNKEGHPRGRPYKCTFPHRGYVLARDPNSFEDSISAALIEDQNQKLNDIATNDRSEVLDHNTNPTIIAALTEKIKYLTLKQATGSRIAGREFSITIAQKVQTVSPKIIHTPLGGEQATRKRSPFNRKDEGIATPAPIFNSHGTADCQKDNQNHRDLNWNGEAILRQSGSLSNSQS
ncbi:hypothetical protein TNCV_4296151 [Trichonephila clavipes]|nr:hypothetical protein TNCV_4296151 [Trichonephila clavipes]